MTFSGTFSLGRQRCPHKGQEVLDFSLFSLKREGEEDLNPTESRINFIVPQTGNLRCSL